MRQSQVVAHIMIHKTRGGGGASHVGTLGELLDRALPPRLPQELASRLPPRTLRRTRICGGSIGRAVAFRRKAKQHWAEREVRGCGTC